MNKKIAVVVALILAATVGWQIHQKQNREAVKSGISTDVNASGEINVFAASSLTGTFTQLGKEFEASHPGVKVNFTFGSSSTLAQQINAGAPAHIFASASKKAMDTAGERITSKEPFVMNFVVVAGKSAQMPKAGTTVTAREILSNASSWIQCAHEAPCGVAADKALAAEGVTTKPKSLEPDVKSVLAKLLAGEVDYAVVYHTDVVAQAELGEVEFADKKADVTDYAIGQVDDNSPLAQEFLSYLTDAHAMDVYSKAGFGVPSQ